MNSTTTLVPQILFQAIFAASKIYLEIIFSATYHNAVEGRKVMNTSFGTSVSGLRAAMLHQDNTAHSIANVNTAAFVPQRLNQSETHPSGTAVTGAKPDTPDLNGDMTDMITNKHTYSANLKMIKAQDNMMGELIDLVG